jgi:hypothetical protein
VGRLTTALSALTAGLVGVWVWRRVRRQEEELLHALETLARQSPTEFNRPTRWKEAA